VTAYADLLGDGSLGVWVDPALRPATRRWVLGMEALPAVRGRMDAALRVRAAPPAAVPRDGPAALRVLDVGAWIGPGGDDAVLAAGDGRCSGTVDLRSLRAEVRVDTGAGAEAVEPAVYGALALSTALLLTRRGRVLLHAAAVVAPDGPGWLLAGDSGSGKSSSCATLVRAGLRYLSDDQVVVDEEGESGAFRLSAWPRRFHLDDGYAAGATLGTRSAADPAHFGDGRWCRSAPLAGVIFTTLEAGRPTRLEALSRAEGLARLLRHSPWLAADRAAAPLLLERMSRLSALPLRRLRLGRDSYADPARLRRCLSAAWVGG